MTDMDNLEIKKITVVAKTSVDIETAILESVMESTLNECIVELEFNNTVLTIDIPELVKHKVKEYNKITSK